MDMMQDSMDKNKKALDKILAGAMTNQEINEAVARKLGWVIDKTSDYSPWYGRPNARPESAMIRELPDYCTDIRAAWELIKPEYVFICREDNGIWKCDMGHGCVSVDTAPMAICLAFLKLPT